jgi:hypothetical protein
MEALRDLLTGAASMRSNAPAYIPRIRSIFVMVTPSYLPLLRDFAKAKTAGIKEFDAGSFESVFPALHSSFLLVRLGGFAADYFRDYPSALRAAGLSEARCGGFGEAEARLITIGELDATRLECTL